MSAIQASKFSKTSFLQWAQHWMFEPKSGIHVKVNGYNQKEGEFLPTRACDDCKELWLNSGLETAITNVEWGALTDQEDFANVVCGVKLYTCI